MKGRMMVVESRVMTTGGLGLFLDPGGRPRGRRDTSMLAPSPPVEVFFCFLCELEGDSDEGFWVLLLTSTSSFMSSGFRQ